MAAYVAFVKVVLNYSDGTTHVVSKQFSNPQEFISWVEDATESYNESIGTYSLKSYLITEKVNSEILSVENVSYDSRHNFQIRKG